MSVDAYSLRYLPRRSSKNCSRTTTDRQTCRFKENFSIDKGVPGLNRVGPTPHERQVLPRCPLPRIQAISVSILGKSHTYMFCTEACDRLDFGGKIQHKTLYPNKWLLLTRRRQSVAVMIAVVASRVVSSLKLVYSKQPIHGLTREFCWVGACVGGSCRNIKLSGWSLWEIRDC